MRLLTCRCAVIVAGLVLTLAAAAAAAAAAVILPHESRNQQLRQSNKDRRKLLIIGLGRVGLQCGRLALENDFDNVVGTVRTALDTAEEYQATIETTDILSSSTTEKDGRIKRILFDINSIREELQDTTHVLWTIPILPRPKKVDGRSSSLRQNKENEDSSSPSILLDQIVEEVVKASNQHSNNILWTGFLSTTGVYGNHNGAWVTEESHCLTKGNAKAYMELEPNFQYVFRCAGIYDSTRSALHTIYKKGYSNVMSSDNVTNRIHSLDIARAVIAAMLFNYPHHPLSVSSSSETSPFKPRIYNLADHLPATRKEVFDYATMLFTKAGIEIPPKTKIQTTGDDDALLSVRARRRQSEQKVVSNQRMINELIPTMIYPTYKEGLDSILHDPETPWNGYVTKQ